MHMVTVSTYSDYTQLYYNNTAWFAQFNSLLHSMTSLCQMPGESQFDKNWLIVKSFCFSFYEQKDLNIRYIVGTILSHRINKLVITLQM